MLCCYTVSVGRLKMITIFDLSFAAIPDLNKQAEDIDFFFEEYIRLHLFKIKMKPGGKRYFRNYGDGAKNIRLSNCMIDSLSGLGKVLTNLQKHKIIIRFRESLGNIEVINAL